MRKQALLMLFAILSFTLLHAQEGTCISGNCKTGYGSMRYPDSSVYTGTWKAGKRDGRGTLDEAEKTYTGRWTAGVPGDSGVFVVKHILYREHRLYAMDILVGKAPYDNAAECNKLDGKGMMIKLSTGGGRTDTLEVLKGNFVNGQLSGAGTFRIPGLTYDTSDSWTDNYHFTSGTTIDLRNGEKRTGSYELGIVTETPESIAARSAAAPAPAAATRSASSTATTQPTAAPAKESMLDYGIFNYHQKKLKQEDIATYTPASNGSQNGATNTNGGTAPKKDAWSMCSCCKGKGYTETYTSDTRYTYQNRYGTNTDTKMLRTTCSCCHGTGR